MEKARHEGKPVTIVREARQGDTGFDEKKNQVLVEFDDGTQKVVAPDEVQDRTKNFPAAGSEGGQRITGTRTVK